MAKLNIKGKEVKKLGYPDSTAVSIALEVVRRHYKRSTKDEVLNILKNILNKPEDYTQDEVLGKIAKALMEEQELRDQKMIKIADEAKEFRAFGAENIEAGAFGQMETAMKLPVALAGALMADAHHGYGLPIGGVLATENTVIPYGVGMDIGCRMRLSILDIKPSYLKSHHFKLKNELKENTRFGIKVFDDPMDDEVLDREEFKTVPFIKRLKDKAWKQIGSSGSGNHFVEFGIVHLTDPDNEFDLPTGEYLGLLSHSGSRGFGANIAQHYTKVAMEKCWLPKEAQHLAWLDLDSEEGMEYWLGMNLAGAYASACHRHIHKRLCKAIGENVLAVVENHHNFAWKETLADGTEVIVHRKGATPAGKGVLGVIPGSMTAEGFIVRGKGNPISLNSASHGAGRQMSRTKAKNSITPKELKQLLAKKEVTLIGGGLDEAPMAYKDIHKVMACQTDLVDVVGTFTPKIVRMDS